MELDNNIFFEDDEEQRDPITDAPEGTELEGEEDQVDDQDTIDTEEEQEDIPTEVLQNYYSHLTQLGVIRAPEGFEFDGSVEKLEEALDYTKNSTFSEAAEALEAKLPDDFKPLLQYALAGGTSLDAYLAAYGQSDVLALDPSKIDNQKKIVAEWYRETTTHDEEKIAKMVARLENKGEIEEEALDAIEDLKTIKEKRKNELVTNAAAEKQQREAQAQKEQKLITQAIDEYFDTPVRAEKAKAFLFAPVKQGDTTTTQFNIAVRSISANPKHLSQLVELVMDYDPDNGIKLDRIEKVMKTKGSKTFKELLQEKLDSKPSVKGTVKSQGQNKFSWGAFNEIEN